MILGIFKLFVSIVSHILKFRLLIWLFVLVDMLTSRTYRRILLIIILIIKPLILVVVVVVIILISFFAVLIFIFVVSLLLIRIVIIILCELSKIICECTMINVLVIYARTPACIAIVVELNVEVLFKVSLNLFFVSLVDELFLGVLCTAFAIAFVSHRPLVTVFVKFLVVKQVSVENAFERIFTIV